jgi:uncharacterized C2H2 Zn-finger protein
MKKEVRENSIELKCPRCNFIIRKPNAPALIDYKKEYVELLEKFNVLLERYKEVCKKGKNNG